MKLNKYIDHTILKAYTTTETINKFVDIALEYDFASVCVSPCFLKHIAKRLKGSNVKACTVVGFPLGANRTEVKVLETKLAVEDGAQEIDMVINISAAKDHNYDYIYEEINAIKEACGDASLKVIIETGFLTLNEKIEIVKLFKRSNADYIKTSTGFGEGYATVEDIKLFKSILNDEKYIKASSGIKTKEIALKLIEAGADRLGTSSGIDIVS